MEETREEKEGQEERGLMQPAFTGITDS